MTSPILINHVGFPCLAPKRFLIKNPPATSLRIEHLIHTRLSPVYEGELTQLDETVWEGDYQVVVGDPNENPVAGWNGRE